MKKRRILACLLAAVLLLTLVPWTPAAAQGDQPVPEPQQTPAPDSGDEPAVSEHVMRLPAEEGQDLHRLVYLNEDGSRTLYLFDHPVKYVDADGTVRDISLEIADGATDQARFVTAANAAVASFSRTLWDGISLSGNGTNLRLVPVQPELDGTLSATEEATAQRLDSETIQYRYDAATTFEYSLTYTGFKEDIVVSQYTGQTEYAFFLYTDGLSVTQLQDSWYLTDDTGAVRAAIGDIVVFTADERNNTMGRLESEVIKENEIYLLTIVLDADYLADPNTVYPIRIDPTVDIIYEQSGAAAIEDVTIYSNATSQGQFTASVVGKTSNGIARLLMRFPNFDFSALEGATVTYARVTPRDILCEGEEMTVTCYPYTGTAWAESTAQWSNLTQSWDASMGVSLPISYSKGLEQPTDHWYRFEITELVQKWIDGEADPALGIIFKANSTVEDGSAYLHKTFGSYERSGYKPWFTMTYLWDLQLNHGVKDIDEGGSFTLTATTSDGPATNVTWTSSNTAVATVDANGVVTAHKAGVATITATSPDAVKPAICRVYVTIADGVYYIRNNYSQYYLGVENAGITGLNNVELQEKVITDGVDSLCQMWKITYLSDGKYVIRPMHKLDKALDKTNQNADIYYIGNQNSLTAVPSAARWTVEWVINGYVLKTDGNTSHSLRVENTSSAVGANVCVANYLAISECYRWGLLKIEVPPVGVVLYDIFTQEVTPDPSRHLAIGATKTLSQYGLSAAAYAGLGIDQQFTWLSSDSSIATVDYSTGAVTGVSTGVVTITGRKLLGGQFYYVHFGVCVGYPSFFNALIDNGDASYHQFNNTDDGFFMCTQSLAAIFLKNGITDIPEVDEPTKRMDVARYYDDWYIFCVKDGSHDSYGVYRMREQEFDYDENNDGTQDGDSDDPGATVSFAEFDISILNCALADPTDINLNNLSLLLDSAISDLQAEFDDAIVGYFVRTESDAPYLIAEEYVRMIANTMEGNELAVPLPVIRFYEDIERLEQQMKDYSYDPSVIVYYYQQIEARRRVLDSLLLINEEAGHTIYDEATYTIYIQDPANLSYHEKQVLLLSHCGNVTFNSFAAEIEFHADALLDWMAKYNDCPVFDDWYHSAIRSEMGVGEDSDSGFYDDYFDLESDMVQAQAREHGEY